MFATLRSCECARQPDAPYRASPLTIDSARNVVGIGPMQLLAWFAPMAIGGCFLAVLGGCLIDLVDGSWMLALTCLGNIVASLLFISAQEDVSYWLCVFPAMICVTISMDLIFNQVNVFLSTELPSHEQGVAASLSHALIHLSAPLLLALAGDLDTQVPGHVRKDYTHAFWIQCVCGVISMAIFAFLVPMGTANKQGDAWRQEHVTQTDEVGDDQAENDEIVGSCSMKHASV